MSKDVVPRLSDGDAALFDVDELPSVQLADIRHESEDVLVARGAAYVSEYVKIADHPTILLKNLAAVVVALRFQYQDLRGSSHDYRQRVADMYRKAGIEPDSSSKVQTAVRWHIGNLLRQTLTTRELETLGLLTTSPLERLQDNRAVNAAIVTATKISQEVDASTPRKPSKKTKGEAAAAEQPERTGSPVKATADHLRLAHVARTILGQLDADVIDHHMAAGQRAKLDDELAEIQKTVAALRRRTRKPSSGG